MKHGIFAIILLMSATNALALDTNFKQCLQKAERFSYPSERDLERKYCIRRAIDSRTISYNDCQRIAVFQEYPSNRDEIYRLCDYYFSN